ncbi:NADH-quinone oxidoreductase subunit N [Flavobacterium sp. xlx-214]|uniref:NADH-quinone oxidoreductase subunit N n=1 Tax=unclassified Flavobacterium TaxID=196869 RepID=UPI0013D65A3C|nr:MULTISPECIES: NADH-quinone oxidoreductase subunit N [unclassified Flavobacterium]MBA5793042.1 NADH-quinone oxidoreductase subunit N [Flavobacterium sp. xlx-221]QMI84630.1 NADH-quinone oxidoreductase subunit N [Flavobacterium sp. xlx-214]
MSTLIALASLAVLILVLEIINLRKGIVPLTLIGLMVAFGLNWLDLDTTQSFYNNMIVVNKTTVLFNALFIVLTYFIVALGQAFYKEHYDKISDYTSLKIFLLIGAYCMVSFGNMVMFFMGLEILSITLYVLAGSDRTNIKSNESGMKYFLMGSFASGFILFGIALIYGATASFDIDQIVLASTQLAMPKWFMVGFVMLLVGLLFKIAAFPFHFWAPDVYQGAPLLTTTTMSTLAKVAAVGAFYKISLVFFPSMPANFSNLIAFLIVITLIVGNVMALKQNNIKRLMAYSGISHAGFMLMAILLGKNAEAHLFYYMLAYAISGIAAFSVILYVCQDKQEELIMHFRGFAKHKPVLAVTLSLALLSMAGIPILAGFFGKLFLFTEALNQGYYVMVIIAVITSIISIYYYFKVIITMFTYKTSDAKTVYPQNHMYTVVAITAIVINLIIGFCPSIIIDLF